MFIEKLIRQNDETAIDIFIETNKDNPNIFGEGNLNQVISYFKDCFSRDRKECKYQNLRFHGVDIRFENLMYRGIYALMIILERTPGYIPNINSEPIRSILKKLTSVDIKNLIKTTKILKQFSRLPLEYPEVKKLLQTYISKFENIDIITQYQKMLELINSNNHTKYFDLLAKIKELILYFAGMMDLYLLGRMFKTFSQTSKNFIFNTHTNAERIIIYAGDKHANTYRTFLSKLNFKLSFGTPEVYNNYHDIANMELLAEVKDLNDMNNEQLKHILDLAGKGHKLSQLIISNFNEWFQALEDKYTKEGNLALAQRISNIPEEIKSWKHSDIKCLDITNLNKRFFWSLD